MKSPILGQAYVARSVNAADSRMVNLFPEVLTEGKSSAYLQRAPGLRLVATVGEGPIRGMWPFGDFLYVVSGGQLFRVDTNFQSTYLGLVNGSGPVSMTDNGEQLFIACNPDAFIYNASTGVFGQVTDPDFPGAVTVGYLDGYFVFNQPGSQRFWVTSLNDGTQIDPLDFASAEGNPDGIVALIVDHREVWLFGSNSTEVWYNAGLPDFPLARIQGAFMEIGCLAPYSVAKMDNSVFWLGSDARGNGIVYRAEGYRGKRISTHAVEWQIQQYGVLNDALAYTYQQDGHSFYVLVFPTANTTWVYDASTGVWHERAAWNGVEFRRHRGNCQANFNNMILVGDAYYGAIFEFDLETFSDSGQTQRWLRSWRALPPDANNLNRQAHHSLQIDCESGINVAQVAYTLNAANIATGITQAISSTQPGLAIFAERFDGRQLGDIDGDGVLTAADVAAITAYGNGTLTDATQRLYIEGRIFYEMSKDPAKYYNYLDYNYLNVAITTALLATETGDLLITESGDFLEITQAAVFATNTLIMLRWSDDGGHTWSNEHKASLGSSGQYNKRVFFRRLGMTMKLRDRVYELSGSDPVKVAILGAELILSPTRS
jgi:hypothetical protein